MAISDEELVRRLESMPMVDSPDFREPVMAQIRFSPRVRRVRTRTMALGLAWAAAVAIVIGIAFFRPPSRQTSSATMTAATPSLDVKRDGERFVVQPSVRGDLEWDHSKLRKVQDLPDGSIVLQRVPGATGAAEIRLRLEKEVVKTSVAIN